MDRKKSHTFVVTKIVYSLSYQFVLFVVQQLGCFGLEVYHSRRYLTLENPPKFLIGNFRLYFACFLPALSKKLTYNA